MERKKILMALAGLSLTAVAFSEPAFATSLVIDNQDSSYYFYKGGDSRYWYSASCSVCVNGTFIYTGNTYNSVGNYGIWYQRLANGFFQVEANVPNHTGANTTNAIYEVFENSSDTTAITHNLSQSASSGWKSLFGVQPWAENGGYVRLTDKTFEANSTKYIGFDGLRWTN